MAARFVLLTGLSGAGKSTAAKCFEDIGYYTVDNLPPPLLAQLIDEQETLAPGRRHIAVVADVRAPGFAEEFPRLLDNRSTGQSIALIFFEASDEVLVRRFSETRRPHPLAKDRPVVDGIRLERDLLAPLRSRADLVVDTGEWTVHDLRRQIFRDFAPEPGMQQGLVVSLTSFGFKHGIPKGTDLLFDVRYLANPHFVPGLREQTGKDSGVLEYLRSSDDFGELRDRIRDFLLYVLPKYQRENRTYLAVAIGCTGGRHRSVAMADELGQCLLEADWSARVSHRDIDKGP